MYLELRDKKQNINQKKTNKTKPRNMIVSKQKYKKREEWERMLHPRGNGRRTTTKIAVII